MKSLKDFYAASDLPQEVLDKLFKGIKQKSIKKGTVLQSSGDEGHYSYFVREGLLRSYTIDEKGKEHVFMFAPEGWVIGDIESHTFDKPTVLYIDALEDCEIDVIDASFFNFIDELPSDALKSQVVKLQRRVSVLQHRVLMLLSANAAERYQEFIKTYPNITQRAPQKMIASYLGVTPEALSKIRGAIAKG